jgi:hypothetical protein
VLETPPDEIVLRFSESMGEQSSVALSSTITLTPSGEETYGTGGTIARAGPDRADPTRRTLRLGPGRRLPRGLYWVQWRTVAARSRAERSGTYCFAVGMPIPEHIRRDFPDGRRERDMRQRGRTAALAGGVILIALGLLVGRGGSNPGRAGGI